VSALSSLFGKETLVGIDIGHSNIKAVMAESHRDCFRITRAAQQRTPDGAVRDGVIVDKSAVAGAIRQMVKAAGIHANCAVIAVGGPTVQVRSIQMPKMNEADMLKAAKYEAARYISSNLDESALACEIVGPSASDAEKMEVMLIAAPRDMVNSRVEAVDMAGLEAVAVDTEAFALQRSLVDTNRAAFEDDNLRALVDIGANHTEVTLLSGPKFALTRSVPIAGGTFTDALKNYLRVDEAEAERRKTEVSLSVLLEGGEPEAMEAARSVQSVLDELLREVRRSVNYYQSQGNEVNQGQTLTQILLAGGSAQMGGIAPYVTARLTVETLVINPFAGTAFDAAPEASQWLSEQAPRLGVALGLSVKEYMTVPVSRKG
jgi:type IV pilus assembly protein PilM